MNNTNPYRHLEVSAQDLLDMSDVDVYKIPVKVNNELENYAR